MVVLLTPPIFVRAQRFHTYSHPSRTPSQAVKVAVVTKNITCGKLGTWHPVPKANLWQTWHLGRAKNYFGTAACVFFRADGARGRLGADFGLMEMIEEADAGGTCDNIVLQGDEAVVRARQEEGLASSRARAAVQAELDKIRPVSGAPPVEAMELHKEREAVAARGGIVAKTAGKVATDEHTWQLYVEE